MYVRKKPNKSGLVSVQVIDKSLGRYRVFKTIGSSSDLREIDEMVKEGQRYIQAHTGVQEIDFTNYQDMYAKSFLP